MRASRREDFAALQRIEIEAGRAFADVGFPSVASDDPFSVDELAEFLAAGRLWSAVGSDDVPIGYVVAREISGRGHVEQVSVRPDQQGRGVGRLLIDEVEAWARGRGRTELTLSTFRDVAWNAPLYAHLGFRVMAEDELDAELLAERDHEVAEGLDVDVRVFMLRPID